MNDWNNKEKIENRAYRKKTGYDKTKDFLDSLAKYIVLVLGFPFVVAKGILKPLFDFMDDSKMTQRISVILGVMITVYALNWVFGFVAQPPENLKGLDIAGIIGAILTPIAGLITILLRYGSAGRVDDADEEKPALPKKPEKNNKENV